jgi:hypothetical protein
MLKDVFAIVTVTPATPKPRISVERSEVQPDRTKFQQYAVIQHEEHRIHLYLKGTRMAQDELERLVETAIVAKGLLSPAASAKFKTDTHRAV